MANRLMKTLARFSDRITRVDVTLTDENGPRGGVDKRCRLSVIMPGNGELATSAKDENPWKAIDRAVRRARRIVVTKLKRPITLRTRGHQNEPVEERSQNEEAAE
ncbi:hypothetical protein HG15A2_28760 [Adhaeretor mobilis]|uniref:HPF/RaiA family ribosome-associated protein n=1 Tax=Adhaeretor mobilis TaxID=1930276 RepID=A0A517MXE7_9BACT|nr:hypothetical protein HG15A2_28760 [Adhaeretor mobilis]